MNSTLRILLRTEVSHSIGLGHLSRLRSLASAFDALRPCTLVFAVSDTCLARSFLGDEALIINPLLLEGMEPFDVAIVDLLDLLPHEGERLRRLAPLLVGISDDGTPLPCDLVVRPSPLPGAGVDGGPAVVLSGGEHVILHPSFAWRAAHRRPSSAQVERLLICFGGSDPNNHTVRLLPFLTALPERLSVHIIVGSAFSNVEALFRFTAADARLQVSHNCNDMAKAFSQVDAAFISGGTLLFEACALGVPAVVWPQNPTQAEESAYFAAQGAAIALGLLPTKSDIIHSLQCVLENAHLRVGLGATGRRIVAADGANRIAQYILASMKRRTL